MTVTTVFGDTSDGYIYSQSATYSTARSGGGTKVADAVTGANGLYVGQSLNTGQYYVYQSFLAFDTSGIPDTDVISAVTLSLWLDTDLSGVDFTIQARANAWGATLEVGDFVNGGGISGHTLVATLLTSGISATGAYKAFTESGTDFRSAINKTGFTRLLLCSSRHAGNNTPTGAEFVAFSSSDAGSTTNDPKLEITHTAAPSTTNSGFFF